MRPLDPVTSKQRAVYGFAFFVLFVALWAWATFGGYVSKTFLANPLTMVQEGFELLTKHGFLFDIGMTIWRVLGGFVLAAIIAVPIGVLMGAYKPIEAFLEPFVSFARYLPASAFIPLLILWAGIGELQKLLVIFIGAVFQIILMIAVNVGNTRRDLVEAAYTLGASDGGIIRRVLLPSSAPEIAEILRLVLGWAWTYVIVAELIGSSSGIGHMITDSQALLNTGQIIFVTILGPSGCGKSTLLRIVAGLDRPTSGRVMLDGCEVAGPGADRGMVFQSYTLFPWLTVRENIAFGLRERGISETERGRIADGFIHRVGLSGFENHWPKQLSGGMQQRTAIARALANDPKILLLDEPFGALDNQTRVLMQEMLLGIWERDQKTVLFVTHDIEEAIFLGSRVIVMSARPGRIKAEIAVDLPHPRSYKIKTAPEFVRLKERLVEEIRAEALKVAVDA